MAASLLRDYYAAHAVLLDDLRGEAAFPDVVCKLAHVLRGGGPALRGGDRLLHAGYLAVEHARAGRARLLLDELRLEAAEGLELLRHEKVVRRGNAFRAHELGFLQIAAEPEVIGAALRHRDAHALAVDVGDRLDRRAGGHEEGDRDLEVRRAEIHFVRALRLVAEEADVDLRRLHGVEELAGGVELHELERQARALGELAAAIRGDAARLAVRIVAGDDEEVGVVETDAQFSAGGELLGHGFAA